MFNLEPYSKSKLGVIRKCPWRAYQEYIRKIRPPKNLAAERGIALHSFTRLIKQGKWELFHGFDRLPDPDDQTILAKAVNMAPDDGVWEIHIRANKRGYAVRRGGYIHGIMDNVTFTPQSVIVTDLKFGRWVYDDEFERNLYAFLGVVCADNADNIPWAKTVGTYDITFQRIYPSLDKVTSWDYTWKKQGWDYSVTGPDGFEQDVNLLEWLTQEVEAVKNIEPLPNPGPHCLNWYGEPCWFLDQYVSHRPGPSNASK